MPNWVYNTINGYTEELYKKYKGENDDIDFNKVVPEPEELTKAPCSGLNDTAKKIADYRDYIKEYEDNGYNIVFVDPTNPLYQDIKSMAEKTYTEIGKECIRKPDKSIKEIVKDLNDEGHIPLMYKKYTDVFGNHVFYDNEIDHIQVYENYIDLQNKVFDSSNLKKKYPYDSIEDMGRHLIESEDKYGYNNWYDWRLDNWGVKWNASEAEYKDNSISFNTSWSAPIPILAKIAEDNPDVKLTCTSEEESGWIKDYEIADGKVKYVRSGEIDWDGENGYAVYKDIKPPVEYTYQEIVEENKKHPNNITSIL